MFSLTNIIQKLNDDRIDDIASIDSGKAFVYLYRRFGFTASGSDGQKEVCDYVIPTSHPEVFVVIHIGATRAYLGVTSTREAHRRYTQEELGSLGVATVYMQQIHQAVEDCLRDLLRPVRVRDVAINLLGVVPDADVNDEAERSPAAGYGVPGDCYREPGLFFDFVKWVREQGDGDFVAGMLKTMGERK